MAFCIGGKWCRAQECKNRCKSWFGQQPDVERQCKALCNNNISFSREEFLCSGKYVDDALIILSYGYDPCTESGASVQDILDPLNGRERQDQELEKFTPVIIGGGLLVFAALVILIIVIRS
jgi:hypothetical protein